MCHVYHADMCPSYSPSVITPAWVGLGYNNSLAFIWKCKISGEARGTLIKICQITKLDHILEYFKVTKNVMYSAQINNFLKTLVHKNVYQNKVFRLSEFQKTNNRILCASVHFSQWRLEKRDPSHTEWTPIKISSVCTTVW